MFVPDTAPFSQAQKDLLNQFLPGINPGQLQWLAGFIAGLQAQFSPASALPQPAPTAAPAGPNLTILFGSESGNAQALAYETQRFASQRGFRAHVRDMDGLDASALSRDPILLVITSTWGDGEPPVNAAALHASLMSDNAPRLEGVSFAVCALGDTSYARFCQTGRDFDLRLEHLGATRLQDRADCDVDYEATFRGWLNGVFDQLASTSPSAAAAIAGPATSVLGALSPQASGYGKSRPFPSPLRDKVLLSGRGSTKEVWHLEFSLASSGLQFEPGDALAVLPTNCPEMVDALLTAAKFRQASVSGEDGASVSLFDLLQRSYDITTLSKTLLSKYNQLARSSQIERLLQQDGEELRTYLHGRQILDLIEEYPVPNLAPEDFVGILRKLPPRLYSIASSQRAFPDEVHLTVAAVRFESLGRPRKGVASTCLADMIDTGSVAPVYVTPNKHFKLPADPQASLIMVGPGTGVAPFRAFIQDRRATGAKGKSWLFFGDQHYTTDFLYQLEWQEALKDGSLTRLDVAFSRDQKRKIYVQHRMEERGGDLWSWLESGAYLYVCGNASHMAPDVHETLLRISEQHGRLSREQAESYLDRLRKAGRYLRDVY